MALTDYDILEYIQSTSSAKGANYIQLNDVSFTMNGSQLLSLTFAMATTSWGSSSTPSQQYYGSMLSASGLDCRIWYMSNSTQLTFYWDNSNAMKRYNSYSFNTNKQNVILFDQCYTFMDNNTRRSANVVMYSGNLNASALSLFCQTYNGSEYCLLAKFYGMRIYNYTNNSWTMAHEIVPARRKSDNEVGVYDVVTDKFYGNSGSTPFTAGSTTTYTPAIIGIKVNNTAVEKIEEGNTTIFESPLPNYMYRKIEYIQPTQNTNSYAHFIQIPYLKMTIDGSNSDYENALSITFANTTTSFANSYRSQYNGILMGFGTSSPYSNYIGKWMSSTAFNVTCLGINYNIPRNTNKTVLTIDKTGKMAIDGTYYATCSSTDPGAVGIGIFNEKYSGAGRTILAKVYEFSFTMNGQQHRFVAAQRKIDNQWGYLDIDSGGFYEDRGDDRESIVLGPTLVENFA